MFVNDVEIEFGAKENVIQAARRAGVEIPHYCWHPDLTVVASCRMCLVEVGDKKSTGEIMMGPKLVPACQTPTKEGMVVRTDTAKVKQSQGTTLEYLLLNHPLDCSICDQAGECYLQDYTYKFGKSQSRLQEPKIQRIDKYHIGDQIALFTDRCVMCTRCVRFTREVSGTAELMVTNRGSGEEIDVFPNHPCNNKLAGNVVDICPVGALCSKDFLYKKRVWWLKHQESVCTGCSTGCSIDVDQNENKVYRLRPRENPQAQGRFMCDDGRFGFKYIHDPRRLTAPSLRTSQPKSDAVATNGHTLRTDSPRMTPATPGSVVSIDLWPVVLQAVRSECQATAQNHPERVGALLSPFMTCEEAYLLASFLKGLSPSTRLGMGPIPVVGSNDSYPKGPHGEEPSRADTKFTIRAEKCPNKKGVEAVLRHFEGEILPHTELRADARLGKFDVLYIVGGYPEDWITAEEAADFKSVKYLVVQDILSSPLTDIAHVVLAGASFAEREGTFVNHAGLAQAILPAIRPLAEARADGRILMELSERAGLFHPASLRAEMAVTIPYFARLGDGVVGSLGVPLEPKELTAQVVDLPRGH